MPGLTPMMEVYISGRQRGLNKSAAARAAGARNPSVQAARWEKHPEVRAALTAIEGQGSKPTTAEIVRAVPRGADDPGAAPVMGAEEILVRLAYFARGTMADFVDVEHVDTFVEEAQEDGSIKKVPRRRSFPIFNFAKAEDRGALHQVKELTIKAGFSQAVDGGEPLPWTETKLKLHDAPQNLERLAKILKLEPEDPARDTLGRIDDELWRRALSRLTVQELATLKARLFGIGNVAGNGHGGNGHA